jgi:hypothetical protein
MPHPFFGANDVCYIQKRLSNKKFILARRACMAIFDITVQVQARFAKKSFLFGHLFFNI